MKSPLPLFILMPIPPILLCGAHYSMDGSLEASSIYVALALMVFGWGGAAFIYISTKKIISNRVTVDIKPNRIETSDGWSEESRYSSKTHFLADFENFETALNNVMNRAFADSKSIIARRESAHVRVWPGELGLSKLENDALVDLIEASFVDPLIEVVPLCEESELIKPMTMKV